MHEDERTLRMERLHAASAEEAEDERWLPQAPSVEEERWLAQAVEAERRESRYASAVEGDSREESETERIESRGVTV